MAGTKVTPVNVDGTPNGFALTGQGKAGTKVTLVDDSGQPIELGGESSPTTVTTTFNPITKQLTTTVNNVSDTADFTPVLNDFYFDDFVNTPVAIDENWQTIHTFTAQNRGIVTVESGSFLGKLKFERIGGGGGASYVNVRVFNDGIEFATESELIERDELVTLSFFNARRLTGFNTDVNTEIQVNYTTTPLGVIGGNGDGSLVSSSVSLRGFAT